MSDHDADPAGAPGLPGQDGPAPGSDVEPAPGSGIDRVSGSDVEPAPGGDVESVPVALAAEPVGRSRRGLVLTVAIGWLLLDVLTKVAVVARLTPGRPVDVLGGIVRMDLLRNPGSAFSLATGYTAVLSLVAVAVVVVVVRISGRLRSTVWAVAFGLLLGGAMGNLSDRVFRAPGFLRGHVVDFIALPYWPVFNVADTGISAAAALIVVLSLLGRSYDGTRSR